MCHEDFTDDEHYVFSSCGLLECLSDGTSCHMMDMDKENCCCGEVNVSLDLEENWTSSDIHHT